MNPTHESHYLQKQIGEPHPKQRHLDFSQEAVGLGGNQSLKENIKLPSYLQVHGQTQELIFFQRISIIKYQLGIIGQHSNFC